MENVIPFLFRHQYKWIFCYNLSFDGDIISKLLGNALNDYLRTGKLSFTYTNSEGKQYKIRYIENKSLTISRSKHAVTIYDIAQFYDKTPLANFAGDRLGKMKLAS